MKIEIAQIKLKTGDFNFNYENIIKYIGAFLIKYLPI